MATEEGPNVTFVGGRAISQTETLESDRPQDELDAAKAAVKKAIKESAEKAGKEAAEDAKSDRAKDPYKPAGTKKEPKEDTSDDDGGPQRGPDGKFLPKDGKPKAEKEDSDEEDFDPASASVKQLLRNREKIAKLKKDTNSEIAKEREALKREAEQIQQRQYEFQRQQYELQQERAALAALRKDPARAVREAGWEPEQFILDLAQEGTPEGQAKRQQMELQRRMDAFDAWQRQQEASARKAQEEAHMRAAQDNRKQVVNSFLTMSKNEERYPHINALYGGNEHFLVAAGDLTAEEFRKLSGREGSFEQILDYLEDELAERSKKLYTNRSTVQQEPQGRALQSSKEPSKGKGKSLSPEFSGERRALVQSELKDLPDDERREAAKQAVKVAVANSRKD
jgi:hypothetical protein